MELSRLDAMIDGYISEGRILGLCIAVVENDRVVWVNGYGSTSAEDGGIPITPRTGFCIGSISKTLTTILILRLVEDGLLDLDVPVVAYLPGFEFSDGRLGAHITLRHVLSHTTGLPNAGKDHGPRDPDALERFIWDELSHYGFFAQPGAVHLYSNTAFVLAGYLAEVVTGEYYEALMAERVFRALGMERATFDRTVAMTYPLALAHDRKADGAYRTRHRFTDNVGGNPAGFGIASTLDLANLATMLLNDGRFAGEQVLTGASVGDMMTAHARTYLPGGDAGYGLGLYVGDYRGHRQVSHGGMLESYWTHLSIFPDTGRAVVIQSNAGDERALVEILREALDTVLDLPPRDAGTTDTNNAPADPAHTGTYLSFGAGMATIEIRDDRLTLNAYGASIPVTVAPDGLFRAGQVPIGFPPGGNGPSRHVVFGGEPYRRFQPDPSYVPNPERWQAYEGLYEEIPHDPSPVRIDIDDGVLVMSRGGIGTPCTPLHDASFVGNRGLVEFLVEPGALPVLMVGRASRLTRVELRARAGRMGKAQPCRVPRKPGCGEAT